MKHPFRYFLSSSLLILLFTSCDHYRFSERKYRPGIFRDRISQSDPVEIKNVSVAKENNFSDEPRIETPKKTDPEKNIPVVHSIASSKDLHLSKQKQISSVTSFHPKFENNDRGSFLQNDIKIKNTHAFQYKNNDIDEDSALGSTIAAVLLALGMWALLIFVLPGCAEAIWLILLFGLCAFGLSAVSMDETQKKLVKAIDIIIMVATCVFVILALAAVLGGDSKSCGSSGRSSLDFGHNHHHSSYQTTNTQNDTLRNNDQRIPEQKK